MDKNTLLHTTWEYKNIIIFAPKYRHQVIYGKFRNMEIYNKNAT